MTGTVAPPAAVVLDTNVVLDWLVFDDRHVWPLAQSVVAGRVRWLITPPMQEELRRVLDYDAVPRRVPPDTVMREAARHWHVVDAPTFIAPSRLRCADPDDQMFIDLAVARRAAWLVSRDKAVLRLARRLQPVGTAVLPPRRWSLVVDA